MIMMDVIGNNIVISTHITRLRISNRLDDLHLIYGDIYSWTQHYNNFREISGR